MKDGRLNHSCIVKEFIVFATPHRWLALLRLKKQDWALKKTISDSFPASLQSQRKRLKRKQKKKKKNFKEKRKDLIYSIPRWRNVVIILVPFKPCNSVRISCYVQPLPYWIPWTECPSPFLLCATDPIMCSHRSKMLQSSNTPWKNKETKTKDYYISSMNAWKDWRIVNPAFSKRKKEEGRRNETYRLILIKNHLQHPHHISGHSSMASNGYKLLGIIHFTSDGRTRWCMRAQASKYWASFFSLCLSSALSTADIKHERTETLI